MALDLGGLAPCFIETSLTYVHHLILSICRLMTVKNTKTKLMDQMVHAVGGDKDLLY